MVVKKDSKIKIFYNDTQDHVTCSEGILTERTEISITINDGTKNITIPFQKIIRIEEVIE